MKIDISRIALLLILCAIMAELPAQVRTGQPQALDTVLDSRTRGQEGLKEEFFLENATFVRLRASSMEIRKGAVVTVESQAGEVFQRISASSNGGWLAPVPGDTAVVRVSLEDPDSWARVEIDLLFSGVAMNSGSKARDICGTNGNLDAICYDGTVEYDRARPVARYSFIDSSDGDSYVCSGFLLQNQEGVALFLTNEHCASNQQEVDSAVANFRFESSTCGGDSDAPGILYSADEFLTSGSSLDFSLFSLSGSPENVVGALQMDLGSVTDGDRLFAIHHPSETLGGRKMIDDSTGSNSCRATSGPGSDGIFEHTCDTEPGSSGSPLFDWTSTRVVGLHHSGSVVNNCFFDDNNASEMAEIEPLIRDFFVDDSAPDLVVQSPSVSDSSLTPGQNFTAGATVRNQGDGASESTTLRYRYSTNSLISGSDPELSTDFVSSLAAGATSAESETVSIQSAGTFWVGACVDSVAGESSTTNNCSMGIQVTVSQPGAPDLVVKSPSVSDSTLVPGQYFTAGATVQNQGDATSDLTTLRYRYSTNSVISGLDPELNTDWVDWLAAGASTDESATVSIQASGTFWVGSCVDSVEGESNTNNNCSTGVQVTVSDPGAPDLVVNAPSVSDSSLTPGQNFTASATVRNQGDATSESTTLRYRYSTNSLITGSDPELSTDFVSSLAAGASSAESDTVSIQSTGTFWVGACVDSVSGEADTGNNCSDGVEVVLTTAANQTIVITEVRVGENPFDYVEYYNYGSSEVDLSGWEYLIRIGDWFLNGNFGSVTIAPGQYGSLSSGTGSWVASPGPGYFGLRASSGEAIDIVYWGDGSISYPSGFEWNGFPSVSPTVDLSIGRISQSDSDDATDWCVQEPSFEEQNSTCFVVEPIFSDGFEVIE